MGRRVVKRLRRALFVLGLLVLVWMPVSFFAPVSYAAVGEPQPPDYEFPVAFRMTALYGAFRLVYVSEFGGSLEEGFNTSWGPPFSWEYALNYAAGEWPEYTTTQRLNVDVVVPGWLLAFICLAWPVTSFIVARRRGKGRGFEVGARPGAAVPPPDS